MNIADCFSENITQWIPGTTPNRTLRAYLGSSNFRCKNVAELLNTMAERCAAAVKGLPKPITRERIADLPSVYALVDPCTKEVFYVGYTKHPNARLTNHSSNTSASNPDKKMRVNRIKEQGEYLEMLILERTDDPNREYVWIQFFLPYGITNIIKRNNYGTCLTFRKTA